MLGLGHAWNTAWVRGLCLVLWIGSLWVATPVAADATRETLEYRGTIQRAVEEFEAGNYAEARGLFAHAHELYPNARTLRGLGLVAFELRNYGQCVDQLEAALRSSEKPLTADQRASTEQTLARAKAFIAKVDMDVSPPSANVFVDGLPVELQKGQALVLSVGDHVVELRAAGYLAERRSLSITGGETLKVKVVMHQPETDTAGAGREARRDDGAHPRRWYKSPWLWTGVAVVAAGVAVGLVYALKPSDKTEVRSPTLTSNTPVGGHLQALGHW